MSEVVRSVRELVGAAGPFLDETKQETLVNRLMELGVSDKDLSVAILVEAENLADLLKPLELKAFLSNLDKCRCISSSTDKPRNVLG